MNLSYFDDTIQGFIVAKYTGDENAIVDAVRQCGDFTTGRKIPNKATITIRVQVCNFTFSFNNILLLFFTNQFI